jgi:hypothetical protein
MLHRILRAFLHDVHGTELDLDSLRARAQARMQEGQAGEASGHP